MSEKITASHSDRKAIVYIRQSSAYQVAHNTESRRMQMPCRTAAGTRLEQDGGDRQRPGPVGDGGRLADGLRAHGGGSLPGQGRCRWPPVNCRGLPATAATGRS